MAYTPGPWKTWDGHPAHIEVLSDGGEPKPSMDFIVARIPHKRIGRGGRWTRSKVDYANARLIAAAPDMLAALKVIVAHEDAASKEIFETVGGQYDPPELPWMAQVRATIAKAEGHDVTPAARREAVQG